MDFKVLQKKIPYKWKIQNVNTYSDNAQCVAYIDARDAMDLLDEAVGPENWRDHYERRDGLLYCRIDIRTENGEWIGKWDAGTPSDYEKDKGEISDSFKRAAVKWGIGRFLYDEKIKFIKVGYGDKNNKKKPFPVDENGKRIYDLTEYFKEKPPFKGDEYTNQTGTLEQNALREAKLKLKSLVEKKGVKVTKDNMEEVIDCINYNAGTSIKKIPTKIDELNELISLFNN